MIVEKTNVLYFGTFLYNFLASLTDWELYVCLFRLSLIYNICRDVKLMVMAWWVIANRMQCIILYWMSGFPELEGLDNKWFKENAFYQSRLVSTLDYTEIHMLSYSYLQWTMIRNGCKHTHGFSFYVPEVLETLHYICKIKFQLSTKIIFADFLVCDKCYFRW